MRCISLFSGCGGLDLGLTRAGFQILLAVDSDPICALSYKANFPHVQYFEGDVAALDKAAITRLAGPAVFDSVDLLTGGPPCPPFSKSRFYRKDKPRALRDPLAWETLHGYIQVLRMMKPRAFLLENVPGLAYGVHQDALELLLRAAGNEGYHCAWRILNAADYGVPQTRERVFIVGIRGGIFEFPAPTHSRKQPGDLLSQLLLPWRTAGEAIGDLDTEGNATDSGHFAGGKHHALLAQVPPGDNYLFFTKERGFANPPFRWRSRYWSFLLKLSPDRPAWTIQARRSNNMGPFHWRNRILRIEEIKRLQTFPDDYIVRGTVEQQWRQIGNAVPPLLAFQIGRALAKQMSDKKHVHEQHDERLAASISQYR